jgi:hypothetical protein
MNPSNKNTAALLYLLLLLLVSARALTNPRLCIGDPDLWWHLRTGEWIVENHAIPQTDPFSAYGAGKP